jgi:rod shape determining protein RodA
MTKSWILPGVVFFLSLISILILRSVAPALLGRQVLFFTLGAAIFFITSQFSFQRWRDVGWVFYGGLLASLVVTQLIATVTRGTRSWVEIGPFHAQPSQLAVVITALALGNLIVEQKTFTLTKYLQMLAVIGIPAGLIFLEPDLGTAMILVLSCLPVFLFCKIPIKYLLTTAGLGLVGLTFAWLFVLKPYQKERVTSFLSSNDAPHTASYNAVQSVIAVGSGGITGRGLGQGTQSQLRFLPERQTDFVFASFAEETGFIGGIVVISLYAVLVANCIWITNQNVPFAAQIFALITGMMFMAQVGVNIGMNIGLLPITGITLPFISYGGSSILAFSFHLGILQSILTEFKPKPALSIR